MIHRLLVACLLLLTTLPAAAQETAPRAAQATSAPSAATPQGPEWPFAASDLPLDPKYRIGTLPNGMRYIIRPNATPAGTGMVQLWAAGR